jgi:hypothetical protein
VYPNLEFTATFCFIHSLKMLSLSALLCLVWLNLVAIAFSIPSSLMPRYTSSISIFNVTSSGNHVKTEIPPIPDRPFGVSPAAFHGSRFQFFDDIASQFGFVDDGKNPAIVHTPVWLFSRIDTGQVSPPLKHEAVHH